VRAARRHINVIRTNSPRHAEGLDAGLSLRAGQLRCMILGDALSAGRLRHGRL
jgi:hypothetical protein